MLADPNDDEHDSMILWVGGWFDPAAFSAAEFEQRLTLGRLSALY
jgi:hypothetical protein